MTTHYDLADPPHTSETPPTEAERAWVGRWAAVYVDGELARKVRIFKAYGEGLFGVICLEVGIPSRQAYNPLGKIELLNTKLDWVRVDFFDSPELLDKLDPRLAEQK